MRRFFLYFFRYAFPLKFWWFICYGLFSYSCILCLLSHHFYGLFYCLNFRDISLKSQELSAYFSSHFNGFILFNLFRWIFSFSFPFILLIHAFIFPVMFHLISSESLFVFTFRWAIQCVFVYFIRIHSDMVSYLFIRILIEFAPYFSFELFS